MWIINPIIGSASATKKCNIGMIRGTEAIKSKVNKVIWSRLLCER